MRQLAKHYGHLVTSRLASLLLPHRCAACHRFADSRGLCAECWAALAPISTPFCQRCGLPLGHTLADPICAACWMKPPPLERIRAVLAYDDASRGLVLKLKHGDGLQLVPMLAQVMKTRFHEMTENAPLIIPIPLHRWRYLKRRYNQSAELARYLCQDTRRGEFAADLLVRQRPTRSQGGLSRQQRRRNVAGAFNLREKAQTVIVGRPILLLDDVMTTGATLFEAADVLRRAGSGPVSGLVLARVIRPAAA